jgi:3-deoxy-D-manno-octulosonic-acid transferase
MNFKLETMYFLYSFLFTLAFIFMLPIFIARREKYVAGFKERLGLYPEFKHDGLPVIWLHCVSVGETNAARPLADQILSEFPNHRLVISTTTKTGQTLARDIFKDKADAVFYFPFDWKFSVRWALENFKPSIVLLMETEIWPRFIHEAKASGAKVVIVNGRLSEKSIRRYSRFKGFIRNVLADVDLTLMQGEKDAERVTALGMDADKVNVTGNLKFDHATTESETALTNVFRERFGITIEKPLIVAASTHEPEERWVLESLDGELGHNSRLLIAPRHPERFDEVAKLLDESPYSFVRRTDEPSENDKLADIILLDSIGELRAVYPLAEIVFVGGSLIPHGGQSILEPAALGKAIVTGQFTMNFDAVIKEFLQSNAILQTVKTPQDFQIPERLYEMFAMLLEDKLRRQELGENAAAVMGETNRGATAKTIEHLKMLLNASE